MSLSHTTDSIENYIKLLYDNRELIAQAYCNGGVSLTEDNRKKVHALQQARVLLPYMQDEFKVTPSLNRHLDEVFTRQRSYAIGANFGDLIQSLNQFVDEFFAAANDGRLEDQTEYANEFIFHTFDLGSCVEKDLLELQAVTENQFANVKTLAEKQRQNAHYIKRAEKIGEAISMLDGILLERIDNSALTEDLYVSYRYQILNKLQTWRASHLEITKLLKDFLFKFRQVPEKTRRLRMLSHFFRKNPDYDFPETGEINEKLPWLAACCDFNKVKPVPDVQDSYTQKELGDIAQHIPATKVEIEKRAERKAGTLKQDNGDAVKLLELKPAQIAFNHLIQDVFRASEPVSASQWLKAKTEFISISNDGWLLFIHHVISTIKGNPKQVNKRLANLEMRLIKAPLLYEKSGNQLLMDVELWKNS